MWQAVGAVSDPQCTKDKRKLAFSLSRIKSPVRGFRKGNKGRWLSDVSVLNPGPKALVIPRIGNSLFILFCPRKDSFDSDLLMLTSFAHFLVLREHCLVKGWKNQVSSDYKPCQTPNRLCSLYTGQVLHQNLCTLKLQGHFWIKVYFGSVSISHYFSLFPGVL